MKRNKNLVVINGTMGVGKTLVSQRLKLLLPNAVMLDGDWCWDADPFIVSTATKKMVVGNIAYLLTSFLNCDSYENVIFCWVMNEADTFELIRKQIKASGYDLYRFSLTALPEILKKRLSGDIATGKRDADAYERSLKRMSDYNLQDTVKIDVSAISADDAAQIIYNIVYGKAKQ